MQGVDWKAEARLLAIGLMRHVNYPSLKEGASKNNYTKA